MSKKVNGRHDAAGDNECEQPAKKHVTTKDIDDLIINLSLFDITKYETIKWAVTFDTAMKYAKEVSKICAIKNALMNYFGIKERHFETDAEYEESMRQLVNG